MLLKVRNRDDKQPRGMAPSSFRYACFTLFLFLAAFLASAVEMVEALTIVLAVGVTRGWRSTLVGVGAAALALTAVIAALGPALTLCFISCPVGQCGHNGQAAQRGSSRHTS